MNFNAKKVIQYSRRCSAVGEKKGTTLAASKPKLKNIGY